MNQPNKTEISNKLLLFLQGKITRKDLSDWAYIYINNDDWHLESEDDWEYLLEIAMIDEMVSPNVYLYSDEDIKEIYNKWNSRTNN